MKKAAEYRLHAEDPRRLARTTERGHRNQLLRMAAAWEEMATDRRALISLHPELAREGEHEKKAWRLLTCRVPSADAAALRQTPRPEAAT